jgi:hypothetical protein
MSNEEHGRHARPACKQNGQIKTALMSATATIVATVLAAVLVHLLPSPPVHAVHNIRITIVTNYHKCGSPPMRWRPARR